jgi:hypothetical protein
MTDGKTPQRRAQPMLWYRERMLCGGSFRAGKQGTGNLVQAIPSKPFRLAWPKGHVIARGEVEQHEAARGSLNLASVGQVISSNLG